jgi:hypothetical protein
MAHDRDGLAILKEALARVPAGSDIRERIGAALCGEAHIGIHLAIFVNPFLDAILDGRKTIESRFGVHRSAPFERVRAGDFILLKKSGGPVVGIAIAGEASYFALDAERLADIRARYAARIYAEDDEFWEARAEKRFATLIEIDEVAKIETLVIDKRDRRGWVTYASSGDPCLRIAS